MKISFCVSLTAAPWQVMEAISVLGLYKALQWNLLGCREANAIWQHLKYNLKKPFQHTHSTEDSVSQGQAELPEGHQCYCWDMDSPFLLHWRNSDIAAQFSFVLGVLHGFWEDLLFWCNGVFHKGRACFVKQPQ